MKIFAVCILLAGFFVSCNIKNEEAVEVAVAVAHDGSVTNDTINKTETDTVSENSNSRTITKATLLLVARGSEPGWYAEFFSDHLRLLIDNGTDSLIIEKDFSDINSGNSYSSAIAETGNSHNKIMKTTAMAISIENKACSEEASGEKREKSIVIKYNSKTYKGCATSNAK